MNLEVERETLAKVSLLIHNIIIYVRMRAHYFSLGGVQFFLQKLLLTYFLQNKIAVQILSPVSVVEKYPPRNMWMVRVSE